MQYPSQRRHHAPQCAALELERAGHPNRGICPELIGFGLELIGFGLELLYFQHRVFQLIAQTIPFGV